MSSTLATQIQTFIAENGHEAMFKLLAEVQGATIKQEVVADRATLEDNVKRLSPIQQEEVAKKVKAKGKAKAKTGPSFALPPACIIPGCCSALRSCNGTWLQCTQLADGFCKTCAKHVTDGVHKSGTIQSRIEQGDDFKELEKGKVPAHYTAFMKKQNLNKEQVIEEVTRLGLDQEVFTDKWFVLVKPAKVKQGRPKKAPVEEEVPEAAQAAALLQVVTDTPPGSDVELDEQAEQGQDDDELGAGQSKVLTAANFISTPTSDDDDHQDDD